MREFIAALPKAELHVHIEGTLEPELMFALAHRNKIKLPYKNIHDVKNAYHFTSLQSFLDIYYQATNVLMTEEDFFDLTWAYLNKIKNENVQHVEIFFDPQTHLARNIPFTIILNGINKALTKATKEFGITSHLIACFLRDLSEENALTVFEDVIKHQDKIIGIGLDSAEKNNPPSKFKNLYQKAKAMGFKRVAHAGEEGPPEYMWEAINILDVQRIDHGIACVQEPKLVEYLAAVKLPLTVCPLSNVKLNVINSLETHPLKILLEQGVCVTINSDDPAYFGGYIESNYQNSATALKLTKNEMITLAKNSFNASFLSSGMKEKYLSELAQISINA